MSAINPPSFASGETVQVGKRIRLEDGTLMRVGALAVTEGGWFVSSLPIRDDDKHWRRLPDVVGSPDEDTLEDIERDKGLPVGEYLRKRAIPTDGMSGEEKRLAVVNDLLERTRRSLAS